MTQTAIVERIRKLLALARSSNEHEAALAAARAQELLFKYNLDLAEIPLEERGLDAKFITDEEEVGQANWKRFLMNDVAEANFCKAVIVTSSRNGQAGRSVMRIIGLAANVSAVRYLYSYLVEQVDLFAARGWQTRDTEEELLAAIFGDSPVAASAQTWKNSFRIGAVRVIGDRLRAQRRQDTMSSAASTALVVRSDAALKEEVARLFPRMGSHRAKHNINANAYLAGKDAGARVNLNRPLGSNAGGHRLLEGAR